MSDVIWVESDAWADFAGERWGRSNFAAEERRGRGGRVFLTTEYTEYTESEWR